MALRDSALQLGLRRGKRRETASETALRRRHSPPGALSHLRKLQTISAANRIDSHRAGPRNKHRRARPRQIGGPTWQPSSDRKVGNPGGPYAPSRERARFGSEFISALLRDFRQGGPAAIAKVRKYQPAAYMKICALMIPKEMKLEHSGSVIKAMTDEELDAALEALRQLLADREAAANVIEGPVALPAP